MTDRIQSLLDASFEQKVKATAEIALRAKECFLGQLADAAERAGETVKLEPFARTVDMYNETFLTGLMLVYLRHKLGTQLSDLAPEEIIELTASVRAIATRELLQGETMTEVL